MPGRLRNNLQLNYYANEKAKRQVLRKKVIERLGGKCELCGFANAWNGRLLQLHHINERMVDGNANLPWWKRLEGLDKGEIKLVCYLCHIGINRMIHWQKNGMLEKALSFAPEAKNNKIVG
jgi:hypothetical protein